MVYGKIICLEDFIVLLGKNFVLCNFKIKLGKFFFLKLVYEECFIFDY